MRIVSNQTLRLCGALLVCLLAFMAAPHAQSARDFSGGFTNAGTAPAVAPTNADWQNRQQQTEAEAAQALATPSKQDATLAPGQLGSGDKVHITVFGEDDLSGDFEIDSTGSIAMPLVGEIPVRGLTARQLESKLTSILEKGYLKNPRVNVEVLNFRPFFILGEVNKPGSYPFASDMTVINAVALGGGYTTRAKTGKVMIRRAAAPDKEEWVTEDAPVYPGDVLRVEERFF